MLVPDPERERPLAQEGVGVTARTFSSKPIEISASSMSLSFGGEVLGDVERSSGEGSVCPIFGYTFDDARRPEEKNAE